jgi:hypothetical protein
VGIFWGQFVWQIMKWFIEGRWGGGFMMAGV